MRNALIALSLTACGTPAYQYAGYRTYEHFPLDGSERTWLYKHQEKDFLMSVEKLPNPTQVGSKKIHTLRYSDDETNQALYSIKWSSDSTDGVEVHGYMVEDPSAEGTADNESDDSEMEGNVVIGEWVEFSPPLQLTVFQMAPGDVVESSAGGADYTTTFEGMEGCPNDWRDDWDCIKLVVESTEAEPAPFVGTWHLATRYGASLFQPQGENYPWTLVTADFVAE